MSINKNIIITITTLIFTEESTQKQKFGRVIQKSLKSVIEYAVSQQVMLVVDLHSWVCFFSLKARETRF